MLDIHITLDYKMTLFDLEPLILEMQLVLGELCISLRSICCGRIYVFRLESVVGLLWCRALPRICRKSLRRISNDCCKKESNVAL